jgi:hypothetical protein
MHTLGALMRENHPDDNEVLTEQGTFHFGDKEVLLVLNAHDGGDSAYQREGGMRIEGALFVKGKMIGKVDYPIYDLDYCDGPSAGDLGDIAATLLDVDTADITVDDTEALAYELADFSHVATHIFRRRIEIIWKLYN